MRFRRPPGVILKYYLYRSTTHPGFIWPIFTLFLLFRDVSYTQIGILFTLEAVFAVLGEVPTGYIGDRIGRRNSLVISQVLWTVVAVGFILSQTFAGFVLTFLAMAFAGTFASGSGDAWLYDILKERLDEDEFTRVRGRGGSVTLWVSAMAMVVSGFLYVVNPIYPYIATGALSSFGVAVLLTMPKNAQYEDPDEDDRFTVFDALPIIREKLSEPPLRSFVLYVALFIAIVRAGDDYIQPIAEDILNQSLPAVAAFGTTVPPEASLGFLYAAFTAISAVASYYVGDIEDALGTGGAIVLIPTGTAAFFIAPVFVPLVALPMFFVMKTSWTLMGPIANGYINDHTESVGRATVLSSAAMVYALVRTPFMLTVGVVADWYSPVIGLATLGGLFLVGGAVVYAWEEPVSVSTPEPAD